MISADGRRGECCSTPSVHQHLSHDQLLFICFEQRLNAAVYRWNPACRCVLLELRGLKNIFVGCRGLGIGKLHTKICTSGSFLKNPQESQKAGNSCLWLSGGRHGRGVTCFSVTFLQSAVLLAFPPQPLVSASSHFLLSPADFGLDLLFSERGNE